ncbi:hypothetical protein G4L39_05595 [Limisphaera ngatamarikiensis]|uniref:Uncharacterized protein n=1 Tax=Limisphaera ngatamarikiensis TaxID=1324935 RepID=A0A6M1RMT4_9BACT|nr:hypothetical protein [Limisphaera ngatamarikiensis]NGO38869.1 hypothetical protein [Limisphaera ngatamarikiensis]
MPDWIHVTVEYSNAVLVALLPIFSDFAKKLDLPIPTPITSEHVQRFVTGGPVIPGYPIDVRGYLILTNGWRFWYSLGHVDSFEAPRNYFTEQDPDRVAEYVGSLNMTRREAVALAREMLKRMGYAEKLPQTSKRPTKFDGPFKWRGQTLPYYRIEWEWNTGTQFHYVEFNIDAQKKQVTKFACASTNLCAKPPEIGVKPELRSEYLKRVREGKQIYQRDPPPERLPPP